MRENNLTSLCLTSSNNNNSNHHHHQILEERGKSFQSWGQIGYSEFLKNILILF